MHKSLIIFLAPVAFLIFSCGNQSDIRAEADSTESKTDLYHVNIPIPKLTGNSYFFGNLDTSLCTIMHGVDSGWRLVFINDSCFIRIDFFMHDYAFRKGKYYSRSDTLILNYDSLYVYRTEEIVYSKPDKKTGISTLRTEQRNELTVQHKPTYKFFAKKCQDGRTYLHLIENPDIYAQDMYDAFPDSLSAETEIEELKERGVWELLQKIRH